MIGTRPLLPCAISLFYVRRFSFFRRFVRRPKYRLFYSNMLTGRASGRVHYRNTTTLLFSFKTRLFSFLNRLLLLILVSPKRSKGTFIESFTKGVILVSTLGGTIRFFVANGRYFRLFLFRLTINFIHLLKIPSGDLRGIILVRTNGLNRPPGLTRRRFFRGICPSMINKLTNTAITLMIKTIRVLSFQITLVRIGIRVTTTIYTSGRTKRRVIFSITNATFTRLSALLLCLFGRNAFGGKFIGVLRRCPVFQIIVGPLLVLMKLKMNFRIRGVAAVLLLMRGVNGHKTVPLNNETHLNLSKATSTFLGPMNLQHRSTFLFGLNNGLFHTGTLRHRVGGTPSGLYDFFVGSPVLKVIQILSVSVKEGSRQFTKITFSFVASATFLTSIANVPLVRRISSKYRFIFSLNHISIIQGNGGSSIVIQRGFFYRPPSLSVISTRAKGIFSRRDENFSLFGLLRRFGRAKAIRNRTKGTVVRGIGRVNVTFFLYGFNRRFLLITSTMALTLRVVVAKGALVRGDNYFAKFLIAQLFRAHSFLKAIR